MIYNCSLVKAEDIKDFYKNKTLNLIQLNPFQGISNMRLSSGCDFINVVLNKISEPVSKKNIVKLNMPIVTTSRGIDYILNNNFTLKEIRDLGITSTKENMKRIKLLSTLYRFKFKKNKENEDYKINDLIKENDSIIIYNGAYNDIMSIIDSDPKKLIKEEKNKELNKDFRLIEEIFKSNEFIPTIAKGFTLNLEKIIKMNKNSHIIVLGMYAPEFLKKFEYYDIKQVIMKMNDRLEYICNKYNVKFINTQQIYDLNSNKGIGFNRRENIELANKIICELHSDIFNKTEEYQSYFSDTEISQEEYDTLYSSSKIECKKKDDISNSLKNEERILKIVKKKRTRN